MGEANALRSKPGAFLLILEMARRDDPHHTYEAARWSANTAPDEADIED